MKTVLRISYVGSDFCGYQVQPGKKTVQGVLNDALADLFGREVDVTGCSRTDSGVHANDFCVAITEKGQDFFDCKISPEKLPQALNTRLPLSVSVKEAYFKDDSFHPRYDVEYKEYVYLVYDSKIRDPFLEGRAYRHPHKFSHEAISRMQSAAAFFVGEHDFAAYMAAGSKVSSTVRKMKYATVERDGKLIKFTFAADGFLYNMVRILSGTLIEVGEGRIDPEEIPTITQVKSRFFAGRTLPPEGLYLNRVVYPKK